ncbi:MAG TPA: helix-turn-helix domain-containing protein [Mycobacterium sp.]|jgi:AcrR family transcriptional regulator|nr:helix-turn-helix domain-containing protein [Mycobacterium sp.]
MARWEPDAYGRLEKAALALFGEHGPDNVTVAEIAERAGLSERTFYRHFTDKREILFSGEELLREAFVNAIATTPKAVGPLETAIGAVRAVVPFLAERRELSSQRQRILDADSGLREREVSKLAALSGAMTDALCERRVGLVAAKLAADAAVSVFKVSFERWISPNNRHSLAWLVDDSTKSLKKLAVED